MRRYKLDVGFTTPVPVIMLKDPNGEWVKYSDVEKEMKRIWGDIMPPPGDMLKAMFKGA